MKKRNGKPVSTQLTSEEFEKVKEISKKCACPLSQVVRGLIRDALECYDWHYPLAVAVKGAESFKK